MTRNRHFRDLPSFAFHEQRYTDEFGRFVRERVLPLIEIAGRYKREQKATIATHLIHNLILANHGCVFDSRDRNVQGARLRAQVWDAIKKSKLADDCRGDSFSGKRTLYRASARLRGLFQGWRLDKLLDLNLERNTMLDKPTSHALIVLHDKERNPVPFPLQQLAYDFGGATLFEYLSMVEDSIERINRVNLDHSWKAFRIIDPESMKLRAFQPNVCLKQKHSGELLRYARLYTWGGGYSAQSLSKEERQLIRIDGQRTAELDYSAHMLRIAYHIKGVDPNRKHDLYRAARVLPVVHRFRKKHSTARALVKKASLICLNTPSRMKAEKAVEKQVRSNPKWQTLVSKEGTTPRRIIERIEQAHPKVADRFFTNMGAYLMTVDGIIMLNVLEAFAKEDRPALGIHDSIVCRAKDAGFCRAMMTLHYMRRTGFEPVITRAF